MKSTAKKLAVCAAALCLLACGTAVSAAAASPVSGLALSGVAMPWDQDVPAESIEAGSYTANMLLGSSQQLSPVVRPRNSTDSVVFISDDTSILTVSNSGVVQAVGVGTTRITAAAGNQICAYTIVVSMDSSMIVTEMDLSLSSNTIYVGNSVSAQLQVRPTSASNYATVALTSSNEKVATVNNFGDCYHQCHGHEYSQLQHRHRQHWFFQQRSGRHGESFLRCAQARCHPHPDRQCQAFFRFPEVHL